MNYSNLRIIRIALKKLWFHRLLSSSICPPNPVEPIVTLLDTQSSLSKVGSNLALLLKQNPNIKQLRVYDEENNTCGFAADLRDIDTKTTVRSYSCKSLKDAVKGAHLVVSAGGCPMKPGQSQKELFEQNLDNVRNAAIFLSEFNPSAIFCIAKPPVEALVPMASEEYRRNDTYDPSKIIGVTTPISMIANTVIANQFGLDPAHVLCPVIGGMGPKTTVPVVSQTRPRVEMNDSKLYTDLRDCIVKAEDKVLENGEMFCYAKSVAIARFTNLVVRALKGAKDCAECAFVAQTGHIAPFLPFMTSIVKLGPQGVASTHMPKVNDLETTLLRSAVPHIRENIALGQSFFSGEITLSIQSRKLCDALLKQKIQECTGPGSAQFKAAYQ